MACGNCGPNQKTIRFKPDPVGCKDCKSTSDYHRGVCRSCELVDGDERTKQVRWCTVCSADICAACEVDYEKRAEAFFRDKTQKIIQAVRKLTG